MNRVANGIVCCCISCIGCTKLTPHFTDICRVNRARCRVSAVHRQEARLFFVDIRLCKWGRVGRSRTTWRLLRALRHSLRNASRSRTPHRRTTHLRTHWPHLRAHAYLWTHAHLRAHAHGAHTPHVRRSRAHLWAHHGRHHSSRHLRHSHGLHRRHHTHGGHWRHLAIRCLHWHARGSRGHATRF